MLQAQGVNVLAREAAGTKPRPHPQQAPGAWLHGGRPNHRARMPRSDAQRDLIRHITYVVEPLPLLEAAAALDALGYHFLLFVDAETGRDSLIERLDDGDLAVRTIPLGADPYGMLDNLSVPSLTVGQAASHLALTGVRLVFFRDRRTGRGAVVYRRDGGHYGMVTTEAA